MTTMPEGPQNLKFRSNRTFICSVVFIDIVAYSNKSVDEQIRLKEQFNALLSEAIADTSVNDRIILDTGDGVAIGFLGDPEDALFVAMSLRDSLRDNQEKSAHDLQIRMGINLGPVKLLKDINNQINLIGDGINVAQRIMSFAEPGQLMVSRSYYDIVSCLSQEYAKLFQYHGAHADKHVREHEIYAVESIRVDAMSIHGKRSKKQEAGFTEIAAGDDKKPFTTMGTGISLETIVKTDFLSQKNKIMLLIGGAVAVAIIALIVIIPKGKPPVDGPKTAMQAKSAATSASPKAPKAQSATFLTETTSRESASAIHDDTHTKTFMAISAEARDILFTVTEMRSSATEKTFTVRAHNKSGIVKSVALYDDSYRWPKSTLTDGSGKKHGVSIVSFVKGPKTISMREAGTEGISIDPGGSVMIYLTFKKAGKGANVLDFHPFIYQGRRDWKEFNLALNLKS